MAEREQGRKDVTGTSKALSVVSPSLGQAYSKVDQIQRDVREYAREKPLKALMAAVGVGIVIGVLHG